MKENLTVVDVVPSPTIDPDIESTRFPPFSIPSSNDLLTAVPTLDIVFCMSLLNEPILYNSISSLRG